MYPFLNTELAAHRQKQLLDEAHQHRLRSEYRHAVRARQFSATVVVAAPYGTTVGTLPTRAHNEPYTLELESVQTPTSQDGAEPERVDVPATWRSWSRRPRTAAVMVRDGGPTWSYLTVHLVAPLGSRRSRVEAAAWSLAGAMRDSIECRLPRMRVPYSVLAARPTPWAELVAAPAQVR